MVDKAAPGSHQAEALQAVARHPQVEAKPTRSWLSCQRKYAEDITAQTAPWWRRLFFSRVYLPFTQFCVFKLEIYPPSGQDKNGDIFWIEDQGVYLDEWKANQDAAKYPFGIAIDLPFDSSLPAKTVRTRQLMPNSPAREKYNQNGPRTVEIEEHDLGLLADINQESAAVIAEHKTAASQ